jgi:hypothetical protein
MDETNLAAAILGFAKQRLAERDYDNTDHESLTGEEAIELAAWLQAQSSLNTWRHIQLSPNSDDLNPIIVLKTQRHPAAARLRRR